MTGAEGSDRAGDAHAAQERLTREARATASALLDWLGTRVDGAAAPTGSRPPQSAGPCSWCPVCALVAALRGEQPELTGRLVEQASGLMMLLRLMMEAHQSPGHADPGHRHDLADLADLAAWRGDAPDTDADDADNGGVDPHAGDPAVAPEGVDPALAAAGDAAPESVTRPKGRQAPVRRESPRSAAFRRAPGPTTPPGRPTPRPVTPPTEPRPTAASPPAPATRVPQTGSTAGRSARPSVQRIPIRRPGRPGGDAGGPGRSDGASPRPDDPC